MSEEPEKYNTGKTYIGIDCGLDGGIAILKNEILITAIMPTHKTGKGRTVDIRELEQTITSWILSGGRLIIEDPGAHASSASGLRSMTRSFAITETLAVTHKLPYQTVLSQKWQGEFWGRPKMPKGKKFDTKAAALTAARKIWPSHNWTPTERAQKPHDGMVDAALLAEYGRRKNL